MSGTITGPPKRVFIDGGAPLGLPVAPSVSPADLIIVAQGGIPGVPGSATIRETTLSQLFGGGSVGPWLSTLGGIVTGTLTLNNPAGGWSTNNFGKQLLVTTTGINNPAIGIADNAGANLIAISNNGGTLHFSEMPAYNNNTSGIVNLLVLDSVLSTAFTPLLFKSGITLDATNPLAPLVVASSTHGAAMGVGAAGDFGDLTVKAFTVRYPFSQNVPLQANNIIAATRLTSDGLAPGSFTYDAAIGRTAGNTLNFGVNSAVDFEARIVMRSTTGQAVCWTSRWGATMGATAATTAIVGAPVWAVAWATAGALAAIGISNPTADTVNGGINVTVTPISLTWSGGGTVRMTKSVRV